MKNKIFLIIIITIIVSAGIGFLMIRPTVVLAWKSWQELQKSNNELSSVEQKKQILIDLKNRKELDNIYDIIKQYIPEQAESGQLVIEITAIAGQNNLKVGSTSLEKTDQATESSSGEDKNTSPNPQSSSEPNSLSEVKFNLSLSGSFSDIINFLRTAETTSRLITFKNISLSSESNQNEENISAIATIKAQIVGVAYYKPQITLEKNINNLEVSDETIKKFLDLKTYGQPINLPAESGFGRINPFEGY